MVELICPAGNFAMLEAARQAGADAVYFGIKELNMRANADNFELKDIDKIAKRYKDIKKYFTLNTIIYENEISKVEKILKKIKGKVDAVILWDLSVLKLAKKIGIPVHLSTQASVSNSEAAKFYKKLGVKRINLAREVSLDEIKEIKKKSGIEVECFVHGAMCMSISGRCFISQDLYGKSANRGECLQPCRREYEILGEEGEELKIGKNYLISAKDLCCLPFLDKLVKAKIDGFKIEGRNRSPEYVKAVCGAYREAISAINEKKFNKELIEKLMEKVRSVYNRGFSNGFYFKRPIAEFSEEEGNLATEKKVNIGRVENYLSKKNVAVIKIFSGEIKKGDELIIIGNKTGVKEIKVNEMEINHHSVERAGKGLVAVKIKGIRENDKVYRMIRNSKA